MKEVFRNSISGSVCGSLHKIAEVLAEWQATLKITVGKKSYCKRRRNKRYDSTSLLVYYSLLLFLHTGTERGYWSKGKGVGGAPPLLGGVWHFGKPPEQKRSTPTFWPPPLRISVKRFKTCAQLGRKQR